MDLNSLIHSTDSSDEGKTSSSGSDSSQSSVNNGHEMVLGRGYGVVLRWFGVVGMVRPRDGFGSWVWCGLEMVSGRGYGVVLRWFRVVGMVRPRDGFRSWALRGHEMVWVMGMVGSWEDHRYSEVLKGLGRGYAVTTPVVTKADNEAKRKASTRPEISTNATKKTRSSNKGPECKVVTKADNAAKRKASTRPEISTNATKKTRSSNKGSRAGSSKQATGDEDEVHIGLDVTYPPIPLPDNEVEPHVELCGGVRRTTRASYHASRDDGNGSDGNVDPYYEARVGNTIGDVLERDLLPLVPRPYYIPYPYDAGFDRNSLPYTIDDWEAIHGVNLGLRKKELYKDPKFITHGNMLNARYDHSLRNMDRLTKRCSQQTQTIKRQNADLMQQSESTVRANEEVSRVERDAIVVEKEKVEKELVKTKSQLELRERQAEQTQSSVASFFESDFTPLVRRFLKSGEFNRAFAGVLNTAISVGVELGLRMDRTDEEFKELSQRVDGFIPDAQKKFDGAVAAFSTTTFPFLDKVSQNSKSSLQDIARLEPDKVVPSCKTTSSATV
ncbi:hypothetical protein Tco_0612329 [Tanacetum coccineum]